MRRLHLTALCWIFVASVALGGGCEARDDSGPDAPLRIDGGAPPDPSFDEDPGCWGTACESRLCPSGMRCISKVCLPDQGSCTSSDDCQNDSRCYHGTCIAFDACTRLEPYDPECREQNFPADALVSPEVVCQLKNVNVLSLPVVADLDQDGLPEVVTIAYPNQLVAMRGRDCSLLWTRDYPLLSDGHGSVAVADLDGDGAPEIVTIDSERRVVVFDHNGKLLATAPEPLHEMIPHNSDPWSAPSIAELDGVAPPEIIAGAQVSRFRIGPPARIEVVWTRENATPTWGSLSIAADLDGDGSPEVIASDRIYDGKTGADKTPPGLASSPFYAQVADFNHDGHPDLLLVQSQPGRQIVSIYDYAAQRTVFGPYEAEFGGWGGPAVIADFDGDGVPDFGVAGERAYFAYALKCATDPPPVGCHGPGPGVLWTTSIDDLSSGSAGAAAFDFNGDGAAEVVYRDECWLRIYNGRSGATLAARTLTSSTGLELPVIADLDGDGHAEIVVTSDVGNDDFGACRRAGEPEAATGTPWSGWSRGVFVLRDPLQRWAAARPLWNQHGYHQTNIGDDLKVPLHEPPSWPGRNGFRENSSSAVPVPVRPLVDYTARLLPIHFPEDCTAAWSLRGELCNRGAGPSATPVFGAFYDGPPDAGGAFICAMATATPLAPGECQPIACDWTPSPTQAVTVYLRAGDDGTRRQSGQCRTSNDLAGPQALSCFNAPR